MGYMWDGTLLAILKKRKSSARVMSTFILKNIVFTLLSSRITDARVDGNVMNEPSEMWTGIARGF